MEFRFGIYRIGFPFIIPYGLLGSIHNWQVSSRKCGEHFKVFAVDQRNHGCSPHSDEFGYEVVAHNLHEFMQIRGLARAHLLGHSMGGKTAMHFALLHPNRIGKLVIVDMAPPAHPPQHAATLETLLALDLTASPRREQINTALSASVLEPELRQFPIKNVRRDTAGAFRWKVNLRNVWQTYRHLNAALATTRQFPKPALFVRGGKSDYVRDTDFELIRRLSRARKFKLFPVRGTGCMRTQRRHC